MSSSISGLFRNDKIFPFTSPPPKVRLVHAFERPFENVVATARTCYSSKGIVTEDQASAKPERRDALAKSIYAAGHHTTFQHAHFQFALENVSRQFLWTFLHSHPFYNSEQVSQRYVEVKGGNYAVPPMGPAERDLFEKTALAQQAAYERLTLLLTPLAGERYFGIFPGRTRGDGRRKFGGAVQKRAQEIARYVLPVATFAYLYHTVSGITLFRYWRLCESFDAPTEQREVVGQDGRRGPPPRPALRGGAPGTAPARRDARVRALPAARGRAVGRRRLPARVRPGPRRPRVAARGLEGQQRGDPRLVRARGAGTRPRRALRRRGDPSRRSIRRRTGCSARR